MGIVVALLVALWAKAHQCSHAKAELLRPVHRPGGLHKGDRVRIAGGVMEGAQDRHRGQVLIGTNTIGTESRLAIPHRHHPESAQDRVRGSSVAARGVFAGGQSTTHYQIYDVLRRHQGPHSRDIETVKRSLDIVCRRPLIRPIRTGAALDGVAKFSHHRQRSEQITHLLAGQPGGQRLVIAVSRSTAY